MGHVLPWRYGRFGCEYHYAVKSHECFGFPVLVKVVFTFYCSLLSVR